MKRQRATGSFNDELGASVVGILIIAAIGFGIYSFMQYKDVWFTRSSLEYAVKNAIEATPHHMGDQVLRRAIARQATAARVPIEDKDVILTQERRPGERLVTVSIENPMTISFLGERTVNAGINLNESFPVDEVAETRRVENDQKRDAWEEKMIEQRDEQIRDAREDCERVHGKGGCEIVLPGPGRGF